MLTTSQLSCVQKSSSRKYIHQDHWGWYNRLKTTTNVSVKNNEVCLGPCRLGPKALPEKSLKPKVDQLGTYKFRNIFNSVIALCAVALICSKSRDVELSNREWLSCSSSNFCAKIIGSHILFHFYVHNVSS